MSMEGRSGGTIARSEGGTGRWSCWRECSSMELVPYNMLDTLCFAVEKKQQRVAQLFVSLECFASTCAVGRTQELGRLAV